MGNAFVEGFCLGSEASVPPANFSIVGSKNSNLQQVLPERLDAVLAQRTRWQTLLKTLARGRIL